MSVRSVSAFSQSAGSSATMLLEQLLRAFEGVREHAIEAVVVALVLHEARAREVVEVLRGDPHDARLQPFEQRQEFRDARPERRLRAGRRRSA